MTPEEKEYLKLKDEIKNELDLIFKANMKIFNWDIPEANDHMAAELILKAMKSAVLELEEEVKAGKYDNY